MIVRVITVVQEFIDKLDDATQSKILKCIRLLREFGSNINPLCSKKVGRNLYELRALGKINVRVFYCFDKNSAVVIHGFIKKSNKIPKVELMLAKQRQKQLAL